MTLDYSHILSLYTCKTPQARPVDLSANLLGKRLHLKSIASGLKRIRLNIIYSMQSLQYYFSGDSRAYDEDTTSYMLTSSTVLLEGLLDGMIICALEPNTPPAHNMSFQKTPFSNQRLLDIQCIVKGLRSANKANVNSYADFWTIANFWKHYLPCVPLPMEFDPRQLFDFEVDLGDGKSGPLIRDLIVPTFNNACTIVEIIGVQLSMDRDDWFVNQISLEESK